MGNAVRAAAATGICCALLAGCGGGDDEADSASVAVDEYVAALTPPVTKLGSSVAQTGKGLLSTAQPADLVRLGRSARSQINLVTQLQSTIGQIAPPEGAERAHRLLQSAMTSHRLYLGHLARVGAATPADGARALPAAARTGKKTLELYRAFNKAAPDGTPRALTDAGLVELSGVRVALRASADRQAAARDRAQESADARAAAAEARAAAAEARAAQPAPAAAVPAGGAGVDYDTVANSGGEGVRYRYSARASDFVPGNGPREGAQVSISCFVSGEYVRATGYWARLTNGYYVPATYLRNSYAGPSAGARYC